MRRAVFHVLWSVALLGLLVGCSAALTPTTSEQAEGLKQAQRIADQVTKAYGVARVRVYATSDLRPTSAAGYSYRYDWIFIRPRALTGDTFWVVLSHELGHATLGHGRVEIPRDRIRAVIAEQEDAANRRGVEILTRFGGFTERQALDLYATYLIEGNRVRDGRDVAMPFGHRLPCEQLRQLWSSFGQTAPPCEAFTSAPEINDCPYDDWMSTGCKAGQPLTPGPSSTERLRELKRLHDERLITDEEYESKRRQILDRI